MLPFSVENRNLAAFHGALARVNADLPSVSTAITNRTETCVVEHSACCTSRHAIKTCVGLQVSAKMPWNVLMCCSNCKSLFKLLSNLIRVRGVEKLHFGCDLTHNL